MEPKQIIQIQNAERKGKKKRKTAVGKGKKKRGETDQFSVEVLITSRSYIHYLLLTKRADLDTENPKILKQKVM